MFIEILDLKTLTFLKIGCLQGSLDQLRALGPHFVPSGFLRGFFFKVQTFGLNAPKLALKKENPNRPPTILKTLISNIKLINPSPDDPLYILLVQERVSSKLFPSNHLFYLLHLSGNFIFLLGLHLRIFFSPCHLLF